MSCDVHLHFTSYPHTVAAVVPDANNNGAECPAQATAAGSPAPTCVTFGNRDHWDTFTCTDAVYKSEFLATTARPSKPEFFEPQPKKARKSFRPSSTVPAITVCCSVCSRVAKCQQLLHRPSPHAFTPSSTCFLQRDTAACCSYPVKLNVVVPL